MKKSIIFQLIVIIAAVSFFTVTQVSAFEIITEEDFKQNLITKDILIRTADNFIVLYDASGSMADEYKEGIKKIDAEFQILEQQNAILPELGYNAGLYTFTPFKTYYEMQPYNQAKFKQAIDRLPNTKTGGFVGQATPLAEGIKKLDPILANLSGKTAIFLFSDGTYQLGGQKLRPLDMARNLVEKYNVNFYLISSATTPKAEKLLADIAALNEGSRVIPFDALYQNPVYGLGPLYVIDSRVEVDTVSESKIAGVKTKDVLFEFDGVEVPPDSHDRLKMVAKFLEDNPDTFAVLAGFTDNAGAEEYNLKLSRVRSLNVKNFILEQSRIDPDRVILFWYGNTNPVASNDTAEGRKKNRRVEIAIGGI
ncbi:MAG: OmpA family protein [Desulfobacteraceae bacterium]|jgi:OOP family OmpA-OmpF porin|nr:OmpA family protein [Desulfobacteraceae bacterium]